MTSKPAKRAPNKNPASAITGIAQVPDARRDEELAEEWTRTIRDPRRRYVHGVGAQKWRAKSKWPWRVHVWVMELVRDDELEAELRTRIGAAIRAVRGVTRVAEEDREVWVIAGTPSGEALVRAVAEVVDALALRTLAVIAQTR